MHHFLKEADRKTLQSAFPFIKISNADEYDKGISDYSEFGLKAYLVNEKSVVEYKDPFFLILDSAVVRDSHNNVIIQLSMGDITVSPDTLVVWF
jgi:hypothetical protein